MDKIIFSKVELYGYHGVFEEENTLGQMFYFDLELSVCTQKAGRSDDLTQTINYVEIYERLKHIVEQERFRLIEALAERVASDILQNYTSINEITVRVTKPHPPFAVHFAGISVEIHRKREANGA